MDGSSATIGLTEHNIAFLHFFSSCQGAQWVRIPKPCFTKCEWSPWSYGPCNASCGEAYRNATRQRLFTKVFTKAEETCPGEDRRREKCNDLACCIPEQVRKADKRCDITCDDVLNPPINPPEDFYQDESCQNKCKCQEGYVLSTDMSTCVKDDTCGSCMVNGTMHKVRLAMTFIVF